MAIGDMLGKFGQAMQDPRMQMLLSSYAQGIGGAQGGVGQGLAQGAGLYQQNLQQAKQQAIQDRLTNFKMQQAQSQLEMQQQQQAMAQAKAEQERQQLEERRKRLEEVKGSDTPMGRVLSQNPMLEWGFLSKNPSDVIGAQRLATEMATPQTEVKGTFGAYDPTSDETFTAIRTDQGIFRQTVGPQGQAQLVPVDSSRAVPVNRQITGTASEVGLKPKDLAEAEINVRSFVSTTDDALKMLQDNPDINTFVAKSAGIVNDLKQEAKSLGRNLGMKFDPGHLEPEAHKGQFDALGIKNRQMQSLITSLAFQAAAASGQSGRSISNKDIERFIAEIGATSSDPRAFEAVLKDVRERTLRKHQFMLERAGQTVPSYMEGAVSPGAQEDEFSGFKIVP